MLYGRAATAALMYIVPDLSLVGVVCCRWRSVMVVSSRVPFFFCVSVCCDVSVLF